MQTKLTLRMDDELIVAAKAYAAETGKSLSQMVAEYFVALTEVRRQPVEMSPTVARLRGSLRGSGLDEKDYHAYLEERHLGPR